jgi:predicted DNA-binding ribbon-helix-helix protein
MELDIIKPENKTDHVYIRLERKTLDEVKKIAKKRDVPQATVLRRLVEIGLETLK